MEVVALQLGYSDWRLFPAIFVQIRIRSGLKKGRLETHSFATLENMGVNLTVQLQEAACRNNHSFVIASPVFNEICQKILIHAPRLPPTHFTYGIDASGDDFGTNTWMDKLFGKFLDDWCQYIRWSQVMDRLSQSYKDNCDADLMMRQIPR